MSKPNSICLYELSRNELDVLLKSWGTPSYRIDQLWNWLYIHLADSFDQMTNLPKSLRARLAQKTNIGAPQVVDTVRSPDGETRKDLLRLADGETIEAVLMCYERRRTACISTQVGCAMGCPFCATGQMGFRRDLTAGEVMAQALHFARELKAEGEHLTNVVLMGMGEPLANYAASLKAIRRLNDPDGFRMGQRRITLSTAGLAPAIRRLAEEELQITLAVSLHAATDTFRDHLVPINRRYNLHELFEACAYYFERTGRRVSFEWALIDGLNDTVEQANALADLIYRHELVAHVNLIPLNPSSEYEEQPSPPERVEAFTEVLERRQISYTVRLRRGIEIEAGCGQLKQRS